MTRPKPWRPTAEPCEGRLLCATVIVLPGNAFDGAETNILTDHASHVLRKAGHRPIALSYPSMAGRASFARLAGQIRTLGKGKPIGIVGFSAGGAVALRLAEVPSLRVQAVFNVYGPPDMRDYFAYHGADRFAADVREKVPFAKDTLDRFSGPGETKAHVVAAFGLADTNVRARPSQESMARDFPGSTTYTYRGGHGVSIKASVPALEDFLAHLD